MVSFTRHTDHNSESVWVRADPVNQSLECLVRNQVQAALQSNKILEANIFLKYFLLGMTPQRLRYAILSGTTNEQFLLR